MNFAIAAAISAVILMIVSQIQRRTQNDSRWMGQLVIVLRIVTLAFVGLYIYFRVTS